MFQKLPQTSQPKYTQKQKMKMCVIYKNIKEKKKTSKLKSSQKRSVRIEIVVPNLLIQILIVSTIIHRSDEQQLILQVPLQQPHLFCTLVFFFGTSAAAAPFFASAQALVLRLVLSQLRAAAAEAEAELGGAEQGESGAEERDYNRRAEE